MGNSQTTGVCGCSLSLHGVIVRKTSIRMAPIKKPPFRRWKQAGSFFRDRRISQIEWYKFDMIAKEAHPFLIGLLESNTCVS